jgi:hypothetical protein
MVVPAVATIPLPEQLTEMQARMLSRISLQPFE